MRCGYPLTIKRINGISDVVACGRCLACRVNKTTEWTTRLLHERRCHDKAIFITLTYSPYFLQHSPEAHKGSVSKRDLQLFFKRLRRGVKKYQTESHACRYFACGEYGKTYKRPHYHAIIYGIGKESEYDIACAWNKGLIHIGHVTEASARYCAKYVQKVRFGDDRRNFYYERNIKPEFSLCSRRPGLGGLFYRQYIDQWLRNGFIIIEGKKRPIPRYYKSGVPEEQLIEYNNRVMYEWAEKISDKAKEGGIEFEVAVDNERKGAIQNELEREKKLEIYNFEKF